MKKYGNPDGPGSMRLAVALPSFVYNKKNHMPILVLFLLFVVIIFPTGLYMWYSSSQQYDESGVRIDNQRIFYEFLNENVQYRQMPFILGAAAEFNSLSIKDSEKTELNKLLSLYKDKLPKIDKNKLDKVLPWENKKAIYLIYGYLDNFPFSNILLSEVQKILVLSPHLIFSMYQMAIQFSQFIQFKREIKSFGYNCIKTIIEFSQCIHQQLPQTASPFLQLPHFTEGSLKNLQK